MENNELVVYGENNEIVSCNFERVDLNTPSTILSYCSDVKDAISNVLDSTSQMTIEMDELKVDEKAIEKISTFDTSLDESEQSKGKNFLVRGIRGFLTKIGIDAFDALEEDNYASRYTEYCKLLNEVAQAVESQKQNTLNDIELKNNIIKEMLPLIAELEVMIEVGIKDREAYDNETELMKQNLDPNDIDLKNQIQFRTQVSAIFNNKLNELEKALILYKEQVQTYRIQQNSDMELVMSNESYLKDSVPILKAQGSVMVFNRIQSKRIASQQALDKATNEAIVNNAKELQMNAQAAVDLSVNGRINMATLEELDKAIKSGIQIFKTGKKLKQDMNLKERQSIKKLNDSLSQYNEELLNLVEGNEINTTAMGISSPQKRIGGK